MKKNNKWIKNKYSIYTPDGTGRDSYIYKGYSS